MELSLTEKIRESKRLLKEGKASELVELDIDIKASNSSGCHTLKLACTSQTDYLEEQFWFTLYGTNYQELKIGEFIQFDFDGMTRDELANFRDVISMVLDETFLELEG